MHSNDNPENQTKPQGATATDGFLQSNGGKTMKATTHKTYKGKYPHRIRQVYSSGIAPNYFVDTNSGARFRLFEQVAALIGEFAASRQLPVVVINRRAAHEERLQRTGRFARARGRA